MFLLFSYFMLEHDVPKNYGVSCRLLIQREWFSVKTTSFFFDFDSFLKWEPYSLKFDRFSIDSKSSMSHDWNNCPKELHEKRKAIDTFWNVCLAIRPVVGMGHVMGREYYSTWSWVNLTVTRLHLVGQLLLDSPPQALLMFLFSYFMLKHDMLFD